MAPSLSQNLPTREVQMGNQKMTATVKQPSYGV